MQLFEQVRQFGLLKTKFLRLYCLAWEQNKVEIAVRNACWTIGFLCALALSLVALSRWNDDANHPWQTLGLTFDRVAAMDVFGGSLIGTLVMAGIFFVEQILVLIHVTGTRSLDFSCLVGFLWFLPGASAEELFSRGFILNGLFMLLPGKQNRWVAVAVSAIVSGFLHAINPHASALSVLGNTLGGVVYILAYLRSGRLWLGIGLHFAWNFVQGTILGFPVSGNMSPAILTQPIPSNIILTGGAYGPEAGLIGMGFRFVAIIAILLMWSGRDRNIRDAI